jgi:hypothetical protein
MGAAGELGVAGPPGRAVPQRAPDRPPSGGAPAGQAAAGGLVWPRKVATRMPEGPARRVDPGTGAVVAGGAAGFIRACASLRPATFAGMHPRVADVGLLVGQTGQVRRGARRITRLCVRRGPQRGRGVSLRRGGQRRRRSTRRSAPARRPRCRDAGRPRRFTTPPGVVSRSL